MLAQYFSEKLRPLMPRLIIYMAEIKTWKHNTNIIIYHLFFTIFLFLKKTVKLQMRKKLLLANNDILEGKESEKGCTNSKYLNENKTNDIINNIIHYETTNSISKYSKKLLCAPKNTILQYVL